MTKEVAILGGGCFWCMEAVFQRLKGVEKVESGYCGGHVPHPTYEQVCTGQTGHAEVVRVTFDADKLSYGDLLEVFFTIHDPTTLNQQGADVGTQYRSVIFYTSDAQKYIAKKVITEMGCVWDAPIVTELVAAPEFYAAETKHDNYFNQHQSQGYCAFVIAPKIEKFSALFADKVKSPA